MKRETMERAYEAIEKRWAGFRPVFGLVLGSGWGAVAESMDVVDIWPYADIPGWSRTSVDGHAGRLLRVRIGAKEGLVFQGRRHWYEGAGWTPVALPVYVLKRAGADLVLLTNAAGGIRPSFKPGDLMAIRDHIHAMGAHPLVGPHDPFWGPRFPDQTSVYDPALRETLVHAGHAQGSAVAEGVYVAVAGPTFETPAEIRGYATWGADAVGMSTAPEAMLANAAGLRVAGLSCITNPAAGLNTKPLTHDEVGETAREALPRMSAVIRSFLEEAVS